MFKIERSKEIENNGKSEMIFLHFGNAISEESIIEIVREEMIDDTLPRQMNVWTNVNDGYTYVDYGSYYDFFRYKEVA